MSNKIRQGCRLPFADTGYLEPSNEEISAALEQYRVPGATAESLLGVNDLVLQDWCSGTIAMPYSAWRLLLEHTGLALSGTKAERHRYGLVPELETRGEIEAAIAIRNLTDVVENQRRKIEALEAQLLVLRSGGSDLRD